MRHLLANRCGQPLSSTMNDPGFPKRGWLFASMGSMPLLQQSARHSLSQYGPRLLLALAATWAMVMAWICSCRYLKMQIVRASCARSTTLMFRTQRARCLLAWVVVVHRISCGFSYFLSLFCYPCRGAKTREGLRTGACLSPHDNPSWHCKGPESGPAHREQRSKDRSLGDTGHRRHQ